MKRNLLLTCCLLMLSAMGIHADNNQTVTLGGSTLDKVVNQITFSGSNIVLHFTDGTQQVTDDVTTLKVAFSVADAIKAVSTSRTDQTVMVFDMQGRLVVNARQADAQDCMNALGTGVYIVRQGNKTVKLHKR